MLIITCYVALVAPFGALFFTALKRALKAEQLGQTFVNGGVIDRADCGLITGIFLIIFINQIVYAPQDAVRKMQEMVLKLDPSARQELYDRIIQFHSGSPQ